MSAPASEVSQQGLEPALPTGIKWPQGNLWSNEPPLETYQHLLQMMLLLKCLDWLWNDRSDYFCAGNLTIYYSPRQLKFEDFRVPDFLWCWVPKSTPEKAGWFGKKMGNIPT